MGINWKLNFETVYISYNKHAFLPHLGLSNEICSLFSYITPYVLINTLINVLINYCDSGAKYQTAHMHLPLS
jgi:hypothetical protein